MILTKWGFTRRNSIKAEFDSYPHSLVILRKIKNYYFIHKIHWSQLDPVVEKHHLEEMEILVNRELDLETYYFNRKTRKI
ncbi:hypothetical protein [Rossellomorea aquimaris]|uniref:hypothetical protein n=1 Tax=Rossellomorea aquimaris TaxID=189382 RepID=UPI0007D0B5F6|nr:hypothetical protein [Rossellomorea aquimaris]